MPQGSLPFTGLFCKVSATELCTELGPGWQKLAEGTSGQPDLWSLRSVTEQEKFWKGLLGDPGAPIREHPAFTHAFGWDPQPVHTGSNTAP